MRNRPGTRLSLLADIGNWLSWRDAGWSMASAFAIFIAVRSGTIAMAYLGAALSLWAWTSSRKAYRRIADIPVAKLGSAPQGSVGVAGYSEALPDYPVRSPLTGLPCLWYEFKVEQDEGNGRQVISEGCSELPFALIDGDAHAWVLPEGAQVISKHRQRWRRGDETCTETVLLLNEPLFILGELVHDWVEKNDHSLDRQAGALLQEWKDDQASLKQRFDADANGIIDMHEWEHARRQAQRDVLAGRQSATGPARQCLRKPQTGGAFIISNYSAKQLSVRFRRWSWLHLGVFAAALLVAVR